MTLLAINGNVYSNMSMSDSAQWAAKIKIIIAATSTVVFAMMV